MKQTEKEKRQQQYEDYVKKKTPVHNVYLNMAKAFLTGGIICVIGQGIYNYCEMIGLSKDHCSNWTSLSLILLSIILTGVGLYPKIAKWGGAGALVPITGFANSVAAPVENMGKGIRNGNITHETAKEQTESMNEAMNSDGI